MPAVVQIESENESTTKKLGSQSKSRSIPPAPVLPLPPLALQAQADKVMLTVDLSQPIGLRLNNECRIVEIFPSGQFGNIATGIRVGYVVDIVDEDICLTYKDFQANMKKARERGDKSVNIRCRPPKDTDPIRPFILQSLKNLDAQDAFELTFKDANINFNENKSTSQMVFERGMKPFRSVLRHVESGDYTWQTCPPRAKRSLETSRTNIETAAMQRYGPACNHMGMLFATGIHPAPRDATQAALWFKMGAEYNDSDAQYNYANALYNGEGVDRDHANASQWLIRAAENGHAFAQSLTGLVLANGSGVPTNIIKASAFWKEAARQREPEAEYRLGEAYQRAIGFSNRNPELAEEMFRRAANAGQAEASTIVGRLFQKDPSTLNEALTLTSTGAKRSHPPAMYDLAVMYRQGKRLPQDDALAFSWAMGAAVKDHALACRMVAEALYEGWGGEEQIQACKEHEQAKQRLKSEEYSQLIKKVELARKKEADWLEERRLKKIELRKLREEQIMEERKKKFELEKEEEDKQREAEVAAKAAIEAAKIEEQAKQLALEQEKIRLEKAIEEKLAAELLEKERLANEKAEAIKLAIEFERELKRKEREMLIENEKKEEIDAIHENEERLGMRSEDIDINGYIAPRIGIELSRKEKVRLKFHSLDADKTGEVKDEHIGELLCAHGLKLTPNRYNDILELYKLQSPYFRPGYLSLHEANKLCFLGESVERFDLLDVANDGSLAEDDVQDYMKSIGVDVTLEQCTEMMKDISTDGDGVVSLTEFVTFFRHLSVETRLRAEASVLIAKSGSDGEINLSMKLGMTINPNCQVSKVLEGSQAESLGIKVGCVITKCDNGPVKSLGEIKAIIAERKAKAKEVSIAKIDGEKTSDEVSALDAMPSATIAPTSTTTASTGSAVALAEVSTVSLTATAPETATRKEHPIMVRIHFYDPRRVAAAAAALAAIRAESSRVAARVAEVEAVEAKKSKRRTQLAAAAVVRENEDMRYRAEQKIFESKLKRCFLDVSQGGLEGVCEEQDLPLLFDKMELGLKPKEMALTLKYGLDSRRKTGVGLSLRECKSTLRVARLILAFNEMDLDKSGFISEEEMLAAFNRLGLRIKPELCSVIMRKMDPNGDKVVSLIEFVDFFKYLSVETHLRAEADVLKAKGGEVCSLDLSLKLGMVVNPNGMVSKITPGSQAEAMDINPGCRVIACGGRKVKTLKDIKAAIASAKEIGVTHCLLHFYDPRTEARAVAQLAKLRVDASHAAVIAAREAEEAAEKTRLKREQEVRDIDAMHERQRQEAKVAAAELAQQHERERIEARDKAAAVAEAHRISKELAEEQAKQFEENARKAKEAATNEVKRLAEEEAARKKKEEEQKFEDEKLKQLKESALKAVHEIDMFEVEAGKRKETAINKAKSEAFSWWEKSSALGCLDASNDLATCLAYGTGCKPDVKRAREVWEDAVNRGHVPSMHHFAMAFINRTGVSLKFAGGPYGNLERATELLVAAAYKGYQPSMDFLYGAQPLSFQSPVDFEPKPMPLMSFADSIVGRRVQVRNYKQGDKRFIYNGWYGTVESVKPAAGKFIVRMQDYSVMSFSRNYLCRPFIAILSEDLVRAPPLVPQELVLNVDPNQPLGIDLESDTLLILKVDPTSAAWNAGVRPGQNLHRIASVKVKDLDAASNQLRASKERGDKLCEVVFLVFPMERQGGLF